MKTRKRIIELLTWKARSVAIMSMAFFFRRQSTSCFESFEGQSKSSATLAAFFFAKPGRVKVHKQWPLPL